MVEVSPIVCPMSANAARAHQRVFLVAPQETPRASQAPPAAVMQCLAPPIQPQQVLQQPQQQQQQQHQTTVVYILKPEIKVDPALQQPSPPPPPPLPTLPNQPLPPSPASVAAPASSGATAAGGPSSTIPNSVAGKGAEALLLPLDLSTKVRHDSAASNSSNSFFDIGLGPRTSSCSSTSSRSSVMSDGERRMKRKEQNKAAAHNYRQRKKSFSDLIESEHENLFKKNEELKTRKARLESQIKNMRALLDQAAKKEAKQAELQKERQAAAAAAGERKRNLSAMAAIAVPPAPLSLALLPPPPPPLAPPTLAPPPPAAAGSLSISIRPRSMSDVSPLMLPQHPVGPEDIFRERKNTWPLGPAATAGSSPAAAAAAVAVARERKKEQNKLASRRFRQRRRMEMTHCEVEGHRLEVRNRKLREACEELESKIRLLKDLMNNRQQQQQPKQQQPGTGSGGEGKNSINAKVEDTTVKNPVTCAAQFSKALTPSTSSTTTHR